MEESIIKKDATLRLLTGEFDKNFEINDTIKLSENMGNIHKILLLTNSASINNIQKRNNSFSIEGGLNINILYLTENGSINGIKETIPFEIHLESFEENDEIIIPIVEIKKTDIDVIKKRRVDVTGNIRLKGKYIVSKNINVINIKENESVIKTKSTLTSYNFLASKQSNQNFNFTKEIILPENASIIYLNTRLGDEISNKSAVGVLYNSTLFTNILYSYYEDDELCYNTLNLQFPINHFIEKPSYIRCDTYEIYASIEDSSCKYIIDQDGSYLDLNILFNSNVIFNQIEETEIISDAYSVSPMHSPIINEYNTIEYKQSFEENIIVNDTISTPAGINLGALIASGENINYSASISDNNLNIKGNALVTLVYFTDTEDSFISINRELPFNIEKSIDQLNLNNIFLKFSIVNSNYECLSNTINITVSISISCNVISSKNITWLSDISIAENNKEFQKDSFIVKLYYKEQEESLWDIGKQNHVSIENILSFNNFEKEEEIPIGYPLLIK